MSNIKNFTQFINEAKGGITKAQKAGHDFSKGPYKEKDAKGNETYWETSDGFWQKREYDALGNETYFERSDGYWVKREFDENGNLINTEQSNTRNVSGRHKQVSRKEIPKARRGSMRKR